ncbi:HDOD domain-containing protein [Litorilituus lipolyticus]|uniref:HDOD domain-containing protein n=1 Tax=Litorilituus lipolyticus TaxID=2491017 RepID=A0A502KS79_9GAMM|nr:HDOD domain-containing protein [Litorilituus lipolyticus]TPH14442.1 HDOD domain-containing protein [Litorilituus lipolyticus]
MFKALVRLIFSTKSQKERANYTYFEDTKNSTEEQAEQAVAELQGALTTKQLDITTIEEKQQRGFYDYLFGQSPPTNSHDELSLFVSDKIESLLKSPKHLLAALPILPTSLTQVIEQINDQEFVTQELIGLIQQEPVIAAKVIELANSTFYNRGQKDITDLKSAFMQLGSKGLMEGVINGFISKMVPKSPVYFQQYGNKIWQHSLSTGDITKHLLQQGQLHTEVAQGYLVGLICNLGDMIIYQLMMEAFSVVHPDNQPNSFAFKELMFKNSKVITYKVAKYWQFPQVILDVLSIQARLKSSMQLKVLYQQNPVACYVYEANLISELLAQYQDAMLDKEALLSMSSQLLYSQQAHQYLDNALAL